MFSVFFGSSGFFRPSLGVVSIWDIHDTLTPLPITGQLMFDWFFTIVLVFGLISFALGAIVDLLRRS